MNTISPRSDRTTPNNTGQALLLFFFVGLVADDDEMGKNLELVPTSR